MTSWAAINTFVMVATGVVSCRHRRDDPGRRTAPGAVVTNDPVPKRVSASPQVLTSVAGGVNQCGFAALSHAWRAPGNLVVSPWSAALTISLLKQGAEGTTREEFVRLCPWVGGGATSEAHGLAALAERLRAVAAKDDQRVTTAQRIWLRRCIPGRAFARIAADFYGAGIEPFGPPLDESARRMNAWIAARTGGRISNLVKALDPDHGLILVSVVEFRGQWPYPLKVAPIPLRFSGPEGRVVEATGLLAEIAANPAAGETEDATIIALPYRSGEFEFLALLPKRQGGLATLEASLSPTKLLELRARLRPWRGSVLLPRFAFDWEIDLTAALASLDVRAAFKPGADFPGFDEKREGLFLNTARQVTSIRVDERGTEVAAGTIMDGLIGPAPEIRLDRPFVFLVVERSTGVVLFFGRLVDPTTRVVVK